MAYHEDMIPLDRPWLANAARSVTVDPAMLVVTAEDEGKTHWTDAKYCTDQNGDHLDSPAGWDKDL